VIGPLSGVQGPGAPCGSGFVRLTYARAVARYEHLPIYKASLDVTLHFEPVVAGFSRYHKYTLGALDRGGGRRRHAAQAAPDS